MTSAEGLCTEEDVLTSERPAKERKKKAKYAVKGKP